MKKSVIDTIKNILTKSRFDTQYLSLQKDLGMTLQHAQVFLSLPPSIFSCPSVSPHFLNALYSALRRHFLMALRF